MRHVLAAWLVAGAVFAQSGTQLAGHWEGAIQTPNGDLKFEIDLAPDTDAGWIGTISIPAQNTKGLALTELAVKENSLSFAVNAPGDPRFQAKLAGEGGKMTGELVQGGATMPFQLTRTGEAKIEKPAKNSPLSKELEGTWEGVLDTGTQQLRVRFVLTNQAGAGTGVLVSLSQSNAEIPVGRITQTGSLVKLELPVVSGGFEGQLKDTQMTGEWSQGGGSLPLTLNKVTK